MTGADVHRHSFVGCGMRDGLPACGVRAPSHPSEGAERERGKCALIGHGFYVEESYLCVIVGVRSG